MAGERSAVVVTPFKTTSPMLVPGQYSWYGPVRAGPVGCVVVVVDEVVEEVDVVDSCWVVDVVELGSVVEVVEPGPETFTPEPDGTWIEIVIVIPSGRLMVIVMVIGGGGPELEPTAKTVPMSCDKVGLVVPSRVTETHAGGPAL